MKAISKLYPKTDIEFAAKMSRRGILIAYKDQANTLSFNACPITTHLAENQKFNPGDFLDFCKEFLAKTDPAIIEFSRVTLLAMQMYPQSDIGLVMLVQKDLQGNQSDLLIYRFTLTPALDRFEYRDTTKINSRPILDKKLFPVFKLFGDTLYVAAGYKISELTEAGPDNKPIKIDQNIIEIVSIRFDRVQTYKENG